MPTIYDVAKRCHCSSATVSKVINNTGVISPSKRAFILETIKEMGYVPISAAQNLAKKKSNLIGVVLHNNEERNITHELFSKILNDFRIVIEKQGYDVVFLGKSSDTLPTTLLQRTLSRQLDAIFLICCDYRLDEVKELMESDVPVVSLDYSKGKYSVSSNFEESVAKMVDYLVSLGHERIVYICPSDGAEVTKRRLEGFKIGLQRNNIAFDERMVQPGKYFSTDSSERATENALNSGIDPTVIMYPDDYTAIGAIRYLRKKGLKVPHDISVTGYDGIELSKLVHPTLVTAAQDTESIGKGAANILLDILSNGNVGAHHLEFRTKIITGSSVKKLL